MAKKEGNISPMPIRRVLIDLPSEGEDILVVNPNLRSAKILLNGELVKVFPNAEGASDVVYYVILVSWFFSPFIQRTDFQQRCEEAARKVGWIGENQSIYAAIGKDADPDIRREILFNPGSKSIEYLQKFLWYQEHAAHDMFTRNSLIRWKSDTKLIEALDGSNKDNLQDILKISADYQLKMVKANQEIIKQFNSIYPMKFTHQEMMEAVKDIRELSESSSIEDTNFDLVEDL